MLLHKQLCLFLLLVVFWACPYLDTLAAPLSSAAPGPDVIESVSDLPLGSPLVGHFKNGTVLQGSASIEKSAWKILYNAGCRYLSVRLYSQAEINLQAALTKLSGLEKNERNIAETKLVLADSLLGQKKFLRARSLYVQSLSFYRKAGPEDLLPHVARGFLGLGRCELALGNSAKALDYLSESLKIVHEKAGINNPQYGLSLLAFGECLAAIGHCEEAQAKLQEAVSLLEKYESLWPEAAEAMLALGAVFEKQGDGAAGETWTNKGWKWKQKCISFRESPIKKGPVAFRWQQGTASSSLIADDSYPLKYMGLNGLRVAVTLVRNEHVASALISLANCSASQQRLALGPVTLHQVLPKDKELKYIHPGLLDMPLEEREVYHLTWRRPCLKHIQQTRKIPGYLQNGIMNTDNFFGNNTFGLYGHWDAVAYMVPPMVTREQFFFGDPFVAKEANLARFLHNSPQSYRAVVLEPGEAKTGIVVFQFEPFTAAVLGVQIGSALYEFPFEHLRRPGL